MDELTRIGLVGTSRHTLAGVVDAEHPADALLAGLQVDDRERLFLLNAGVRAIYDRCGQTPVEGVSSPPPAPAERQPHASAEIVGLLQQAMDTDPPDVFIEFLDHLRAIGRLLPPELLPQVLSTRASDIRRHIIPVLGERGKWIAELNPEWRWALGAVADDGGYDQDRLAQSWDEGQIDERCEALRAFRRLDPSEALRRLEEAIGKEKADHRARLVETLATGLSSEDEPLLESLLDDRSEQVRRSAAACLARISGSALAKRMIERADGMFSMQQQGLLRKSPRLVCTPPEEIDAAWTRDGVPAKVPAGRGKRAVWAEAVLAAVPPTFWCGRFGLQPAELIQAVAKDEFAEVVLVGWTRAAVTFVESDAACAAWLYPLAEYWLAAASSSQSAPGVNAVELLQTVLPSLSPGDAELVCLKILNQNFAGHEHILLALLSALPRPWGKKAAAEYLATLQSICRKRATALLYQWGATLKTAAIAIPRDTFTAALEPWELPDSDQEDAACRGFGREIGKFIDIVRMRTRFYRDADAKKLQ